MLDISLGSNIDTLSDTQLENEILVGDYLNGCIYPMNYINLINKLSKLPVIELLTDITYFETIMAIKKELQSETSNTLDKEAVIKVYNKKSKIIPLIESLGLQASLLHKQLFVDAEADAFVKMSSAMQNMETYDQYALGTMIDLYSAQTPDYSTKIIEKLKETEVICAAIMDLIAAITTKYSETNIKVPKKIEDMGIYLLEQLEIVQDFDTVPEYLMLLMNTLATMEQLLPQDTLDPWKNSVYLQLIEILRNPLKYYSYLKNDKILDGSISEQIGTLYPETYQLAISNLLDKLPKLTYQQQIIYLRQSALTPNDTELVTLCQNHI